MSKVKELTKVLKENWVSNFSSCMVTHSAHGDRLIRSIRSNPPEGYVMKEKMVQLNNTRFKMYRLEKENGK